LTDADVLMLSGGVSAGTFDLVPGVLQELGVVQHFHKVAMKPGKPLFFGTRDAQLVFGLPGNPVSSFVCFELFIRPAIRVMRGESQPQPRQAALPIAEDFRADNDRPTYHPARLEIGEWGLRVQPLAWFGSADLRGIASANVLIVLPPGAQSFRAGDLVPSVLLEM
jgi:molybdopterin molybdotransferase